MTFLDNLLFSLAAFIIGGIYLVLEYPLAAFLIATIVIGICWMRDE